MNDMFENKIWWYYLFIYLFQLKERYSFIDTFSSKFYLYTKTPEKYF